MLLIVLNYLEGVQQWTANSGEIKNCESVSKKQIPFSSNKEREKAQAFCRNWFEPGFWGTHINGDRRLFSHQATETISIVLLYMFCAPSTLVGEILYKKEFLIITGYVNQLHGGRCLHDFNLSHWRIHSASPSRNCKAAFICTIFMIISYLAFQQHLMFTWIFYVVKTRSHIISIQCQTQ